MHKKRFGKNIFIVACSRMVSLSSSVVVGLLLPKILSVSDYGFYKVFTLYAVYTALLHFGFVDGILLRLAGKEYHELDKEKLRAYTRFFILFEFFIAIIMLAIGSFFIGGEYFFILLMLSLSMVIVNVTTYFQFISQAVQRFSEYSAKSFIASLVKLLFVCALFALYYFDVTVLSYRIYLIGLCLIDGLMALWYISIYRDITFGKGVTFRYVKSDLIDFFKTGIVLTMAYQVSHLVLALDRQFVSILFSTENFAVYSFAYNIVSLISTMISSVSIVLLPMLKRSSRDFVVHSYRKCVATVAIVSAGALLSYFPLALFIDWFLPNYSESLQYIVVVLPAFLFAAIVTVVMFTVAKVLDMSFDFFKDSCMILLLGILANSLAYALYASPLSISYASLVTMAVWYLIADIRLRKKTGVRTYKEFLYLVGIAAIFLINNWLIESKLLGCATYFVFMMIWSLLLYFKTIFAYAAQIVKKHFGK